MADKINTKRMLDFYEAWNAINFKYFSNVDVNSILKKKEYIEKYAAIEELEEQFCFAELTRVSYGDILSNLDLIYAREKASEDIVKLFDLIRYKIIHQYIGIEGLERLFSEKYIDFEWDMHLGIDYKSHKMNFYRDHFVHQIRNAFFMHIMLEKFGWQDKAMEVLMNSENSKVSRYVCKCMGQQLTKGYYNGVSIVSGYNNREFYCRNIIYMASYMAALFHDIGYPEAANSINQGRITEYIANLYNAESSGYNYPRLNTLMQNSLLFRIVPFQEIRERLQGDKPDHGALSAIIFLLNFYENGAIQNLEPYKKCAVELAALAIYNHTNEYRYTEKLESGQYIKNLFSLNPVSYLLRISDDLQEWGRIYFELSNGSNIVLCSRCKTPVIRRRGEDGGVYYCCNCNDDTLFTPMFDYDTNFPYRRIYNVTVCEDLDIEDSAKAEKTAETEEGAAAQPMPDRQVICFSLDYKLERLLHIAYINPGYAKYRVKELNALKEMLDYQKELPLMKLKYFMTANPILIKTWILSRYLNDSVETKLDALYNKMRDIPKDPGTKREQEKKRWGEGYKKSINKIMKEIDPIVKNIYRKTKALSVVYTSVKRAVELYIKIMIFMKLHMRYNQTGESVENYLREAEESYLLNGHEEEYGADLYGLVKDCIEQFGGMYEDITAFQANPPGYYKQHKSSDYTYGCIKRFVSPDRYVPVTKRKAGSSNITIDAFTDLALFKEMLEKINADKI